ncbi:MAG TPA: glycosyltransferase, partial [Gaiellaceae bacterium]|nr:glycosyltransferase [Gaiellaceae bacterium]
VLGFVGSLDYRIDASVVRALATAHPEWRLRFLGPVQAGFDAGAYADLPNVSIEPAVPYARLAETLAGFDVGLMPYFDHPVYRHMSPVKNLELLAAGRPAVARPSPALEPFRELLYLAETPEEFVRQTERALAEDDAERAARRRAAAAEHGWERRYDRMDELLREAVARAK